MYKDDFTNFVKNFGVGTFTEVNIIFIIIMSIVSLNVSK